MTVTYIQVSDVQNQLNAAVSSAGTSYTVYGLSILATAIQAHVDYANNYINAVLGSDLATSDPLYPIATIATLDLACIRVLVISMGGSLIGAFDYFLGDLRVARAGPYKEAIQATLQGFREDLSRQLLNLTPAAVAFDITAKQEVPTYRGGLASP